MRQVSIENKDSSRVSLEGSGSSNTTEGVIGMRCSEGGL